jgi:endonuclease YncB( thermonuclease family)
MDAAILSLALGALVYLAVTVVKRGATDAPPRPEGPPPPRSPVPRPVRRPDTAAHAAPARPTPTLPPMPPDRVLTGKAHVIDGDTIRIGTTKIRLAGIDAPERDMPWGQKSKWAMVAICKGQTITARLDGERSHDRLVGTCFLPDGRDIGAELVRQGLALDCARFSGGTYRSLEPEGARRRLANGRFGHASIRLRTDIRTRARSD